MNYFNQMFHKKLLLFPFSYKCIFKCKEKKLKNGKIVHLRIKLSKLVEMFFELIEITRDTVPKKIGTKFAIHGNFRFYDLMNTFQFIFEHSAFFPI